MKSFGKINNKNFIEYLVVVLFSVICVTLFCKASPIYPICDMPDANTWLIQAKEILLGKVPYKDIYEHKGPLQMFAYLFAALPCFKRFEGFYITEIVLFSLFGVGSYKLSKQFSKKNNLIATCVSLLIICLSSAFSSTGSSEELLLSTFIWSLYLMVKNIEQKKEFAPIDVIVIGAFFAIRFWTKYNLCCFDVILVLYVILFYYKNKINILKTILYYVLGVLIVTVPIIIYFAINNGLYDLFNVYFYTIIFKYNSSIEKNNLSAILTKGLNLLPLIICIIMSVLCKRKKDTKDKFMMISCISFVAFMFFTSTWWSYYLLDVLVFIVYFITIIFDSNYKVSLLAITAIIGMTFFFNDSQIETLRYKREEYGQFEIAAKINETEDPKVYYYGAENGGFYIYSDTMPISKYFTNYNLSIEEKADETKYILENKIPDYIISNFDLQISGYEKVIETKVPYWDVFIENGKQLVYMDYYLYQRIENL